MNYTGHMTGDSHPSYNSAGGIVGNDWQIVGIGDFDGNYVSDILWRHSSGPLAVWTIRNGQFYNQMDVRGGAHKWPLGSSNPNDWSVSGVGDFNGDHYDDILWRHNNGETAIWINRYEGYYRHWPEGAPGLDWQIAGVADFNGDRRSDILWRNTDGTLAVWLMNGNLHTDDYSLGPTQDWKIQKTGDFNGDKYADILWRNTDGTLAILVYVWRINFGQAYPGIVDNYWGVTSVANFGKEPPGLRGRESD